MEAYSLPARPLPTSADVAPIVDLRETLIDTAGLGELSPWSWCVEYVRRSVTAAGPHRQQRGCVEDSIKRFDSTAGSDQPQLNRVLEALDDGRPVAFYGWWPTADLAAVSDILGVDAMDVPPPDRKGAGMADGHAVVAVGYGRHAAFPGGGYLIVRNPWSDVCWGHGGDGYLPFTFVRTYATALRTYRHGDDGVGQREPARHPREDATTASKPPTADWNVQPVGVGLTDDPIGRLISKRARCFDPRSSYTGLFFSENPVDVTRAKSICTKCTVRELCLGRALERAEPYGVWGGEFIYEGKIVTQKRGRGRPRKIPLPALVDEVTGMPVVA